MGGDGGSIPHRSEMVKTKKRAEQLQREYELTAKWQQCALSQQPLAEPIVACRLGRLFNKEALIEALLVKTIQSSENARHIKSLKDVKELRLTPNPAFESGAVDKGDRYKDLNVAPFICPVVGLEMNGKYRFCVIWSCGCVMSEKSLKEVESEVCHKCGKKVDKKEVVVLNGTEEEMAEYAKEMERLREVRRMEVKAKKAAANGLLPEAPDGPTTSNSKSKTGKRKRDLASSSKDEKDETSSMQKDPKTSKVYKSLFTSCDAAKNQPKAHWVTYNPLYN